MTRISFLRFLATIPGQLFHRPVRVGTFDQSGPVCVGVVDGKELEIECPDEGELCANGHRQKPSYVVDLSLSRGDEERLLVLRVCSHCGVCYTKLEVGDVSDVPREPSK